MEKAKDSVFMIRSYRNDDEISTGTGFSYKVDNKYGYIITNEHVIKGSNNIVLIDSEDNEFTGKILGSDEYLDLAVIFTQFLGSILQFSVPLQYINPCIFMSQI